jgi:L-ascorbate metabolism protein UlaG (beta-lactamase superfamily)
MTITKYPQSCVTIAKDGQTLLVDAGSLATAKFGMEQLGAVSAALYTHSHPDHLDVDFCHQLLAAGVTIYGNQDVADRIGDAKVEVIDDNEELVIAGFQVKTIHMEHCLMADGSRGVPNTGFILDEDLLIPGDSTVDIGITVGTVLAPIFGPDISIHDAYQMAVRLKARLAIPVHYDVAKMDPAIFQQLATLPGHPVLPFRIKTLENGSSTDI